MNQKISLILLVFICSHSLTAQPSDFPENAQSGKCYKKCFNPPKYETVTEEVMIKEASSKMIVEPAEYDTIYQEIIEEEGYKLYNVIPSEFTIAEVQIVIEPEHIEYSFIPPIFEQQSDYILLQPSHLRWQRRIDDVSCFNNNDLDDCAVWCREIVPPRVDTVFQQVVIRHPKPLEIKVPAVIERFEKAMLLSPASIERKVVPPKSRTIAVIRLVKPARAVEIEVPAEYARVNVQRLVEEESLGEWMEVDCGSGAYTE
ncbi:MAG: hypothetical protein ACPGVB_01125 [Chitinophagales bacterium]